VRNRRNLILLTTALMLAGGGALATVAVLYPSLPDPAVADREGLLRWLVLRDLEAESLETRRVLAQRLEEEFRGGIDWSTTSDQLSKSQRRRVWVNVLNLLEPWFMAKTDNYYQLTAAERPAYVNRLLDTLGAWRGAAGLVAESTPSDGNAELRPSLFATLLERVEQWKQRAKPEQRQRIEQFVTVVQTQWLLRTLQQLTPATG